MLLIYMVYVPQDKIITAGFFLQAPAAASYTHLTLPTIGFV